MSIDAPADPWKVDRTPAKGREVDAAMNSFSKDVQRAAAAAMADEVLAVPPAPLKLPGNDAENLRRAVIPEKPKGLDLTLDSTHVKELNLEPKGKSSRDKLIDRSLDMVSPGFGRVEFQAGGADWRIDYLYNRRCNNKGLGVCLSIKGW
jgi:hypothetical protein